MGIYTVSAMRIRFSEHKRTKTDTQISHVLYAHSQGRIYGGPLGHGPPLGRQDGIIAQNSMQNCSMAPPLQVGHKV